MAGILELSSGAAPVSTPAGKVDLWTPSGAVTGPNGESLANRLIATLPGTAGAAYLQLTEAARANAVRNSGFWFAQRQAPATPTTYSATAGRALSADGWGITNENASATYARIDTSGAAETGLQGRFYGQFLKTTANGKLIVSQVIEGADAMALRGRPLRLQCWMKGQGATPQIRMGLLYLNTAGTVDTMPATFISAFGGASTNPTFGTNLTRLASFPGTGDNATSPSGFEALCALSAAWQRFGYVFSTTGFDFKNLIVCFWSDTQITATQGFNIAQVSVTDGFEMQDWSPMSNAVEYERVRRFYQKSFPVDTAPVTNAGANTGEVHAIAGKAGAVANAGIIPVRFVTPLRSAGAVTLYNPQAANALARNVTGGADMGATSATFNSANNLTVNATGVAATAVGDQIAIHYSADAEI